MRFVADGSFDRVQGLHVSLANMEFSRNSSRKSSDFLSEADRPLARRHATDCVLSDLSLYFALQTKSCAGSQDWLHLALALHRQRSKSYSAPSCNRFEAVSPRLPYLPCRRMGMYLLPTKLSIRGYFCSAIQ